MSQTQLKFVTGSGLPPGAVAVNRRVWFQDRHGNRAVFVDQTPFYCYPLAESAQHRFCAVQLVEAGLARVQEVCRAFAIHGRQFSRMRSRFRREGLAGLVLKNRGRRSKRTSTVATGIAELYRAGNSTRAVAAQVGLSEATVRRALKDQGVELRSPRNRHQRLFSSIPEPQASVSEEPPAQELEPHDSPSAETPLVESQNPECVPAKSSTSEPQPRAPAELAAHPDEPTTVEATSIPYAEPLDRLATVLGMIEEAPVRFESASEVPQAGVLLGLALLGQTQLLSEARAVYGRLQNGWYGLRALLWTLIVCALLRIKRPEQIKFHDPASLGRVLGLPRCAEVKTIRRKLAEIAERGRAAELHRRLAQRRAAAGQAELATLYVDGHVRVYSGQHRLGKTYSTRLKSAVRGETDYWVHLSTGRPLLVVHDGANGPFAEVLLQQVLPEIRRVIGERRVTVVFDRAGWCKDLLWGVLEAGFDFITYRKGPSESLPESRFRKETLQQDGHSVTYELAEDVFSQPGWPPLRLLAIKKRNGEQTHMVASGEATWKALGKSAEPDLPAAEVVWWMLHRWCQENWLKYMREEFLLDVLVDYATEPDDPQREVVNPEYRKLERQLRQARTRLDREEAKHAKWVRGEHRTKRRDCPEGEACGKCSRCRQSAQARALAAARAEVERLLAGRAQTPERIPLGQASDRDAVKLSYERKLFTDTIKICAYEIETRLVELALGSFRRGPYEGRALIRDILQTSGELRVVDNTLEVYLDQLSTPRATRALMSLCEQLNAQRPQLPESPLHLRFHVNPRPVGE